MKYLSRCNGIPLPVRLAAINFLCSLALYSSNIFMPLYAQEHEASRFQIGLIVSAWGTAYFVSSFIFGRLSDRRGRLVFIRLGLGWRWPPTSFRSWPGNPSFCWRSGPWWGSAWAFPRRP